MDGCELEGEKGKSRDLPSSLVLLLPSLLFLAVAALSPSRFSFPWELAPSSRRVRRSAVSGRIRTRLRRRHPRRHRHLKGGKNCQKPARLYDLNQIAEGEGENREEGSWVGTEARLARTTNGNFLLEATLYS